jgi:organic radical activating enzyme
MRRINEIFESLQGEGFHTGTAAVFVRFSGCNLACPFCDTDHRAFTEMTDEEIADATAQFKSELVVLTGGEPGLQVSERLVELLHANGKRVAIETNGTRQLPANIDWITVSPKEGSAPILTTANEVKVVFQEDIDVEKWHTAIKAEHYFLQPCSCQNTAETIRYIMEHPHWRLSLQTHKYIGIR